VLTGVCVVCMWMSEAFCGVRVVRVWFASIWCVCDLCVVFVCMWCVSVCLWCVW